MILEQKKNEFEKNDLEKLELFQNYFTSLSCSTHILIFFYISTLETIKKRIETKK